MLSSIAEILNSDDFKAIEPAKQAERSLNFKSSIATLASQQGISSVSEAADLMKQLNTEGLSSAEIFSEVSNYLGQVGVDYLNLKTAAEQSGLDENFLVNWYDGLDESQKSVAFQIKWDKIKSKEDLYQALDDLQETANKNAVQAKLQVTKDAKESYSADMSPEELLGWKQSSGIAWTDEMWKDFSSRSEEGRQDWFAEQILSQEEDVISAIEAETNKY